LVLDTVGTSSKAFSRSHGAVLAALSALLLVDVFARSSAGAGEQPATTLLSNPLSYVGAISGVVLLLWFLARSTSGVTRCARRIVDEVRRQLGGRGARTTSVDYGPCTEIASRFALRHMLIPGAGALLLPVLALVGLHFAARQPFPTSGTDAIAALALAAAVSSFALSLAIAGIGAAWANAKKYILTGAHGGRLLVDEAGGRAENPTFFAASVGDTVGDALKDVGVPVAQLFARLVPIIALIVAPFLS
jgi:K(+)-stimulated pyrophosphate-energized sodium pump